MKRKSWAWDLSSINKKKKGPWIEEWRWNILERPVERDEFPSTFPRSGLYVDETADACRTVRRIVRAAVSGHAFDPHAWLWMYAHLVDTPVCVRARTHGRRNKGYFFRWQKPFQFYAVHWRTESITLAGILIPVTNTCYATWNLFSFNWRNQNISDTPLEWYFPIIESHGIVMSTNLCH